MRRPLRPFITALAAIGACAAALLPSARGASTDVPATPAERCDYRCTPSYRETIAYIESLAARSPLLSLSTFGETSEGYTLSLVVAAKDRRFTPAAARAGGRPAVLVFNGIHAGEIDGKDASLQLLREIVAGAHDALLDRIVLLVVPVYNVDGHERVSPNNRLAQDGPVEGMGFRTNGRGLDLNRDFVKLETPEAQALVGRLFRAWRPEIVVDTHVTDGMDFQYEMTYFAGEGTNTPEPLRAYVAGIKGAIGRRLAASGHKAAPFADLDDPSDPNRGITTWAPQPRYSTSYFETRGRVSLLTEAHAHKPFPLRVAATYETLRAILEHAAADPAALLHAVRESETAAAARAAVAAPYALTSEALPEGTPIEYAGWAFRVVTSEVTGKPRVVWSRDPATWRVPLLARHRPVRTVATPRGYLLARAYEPIARLAWLHGLAVSRTTQDAEIDAEVYRVSAMTWAESSYQGHHAATATGTWSVERRRVPAGTWWIPLDQPDAPVAVWLLEPDSGEGVLHWNAFDNVLERKQIVEDHVVEAMAAEALKDPGVRAAYEAALASDPAMKADPARRLDWFYRRSRFLDREVGVLPVLRVRGELAVPTIAWTPAEAAR